MREGLIMVALLHVMLVISGFAALNAAGLASWLAWRNGDSSYAFFAAVVALFVATVTVFIAVAQPLAS